MAGRAVGVLLAVAVAALLAAAARAADDDDKKQPWKCFRSCARGCYHHHDNYAATVSTDFPSSGDAAEVSAVTGECKNGCHDDECFKDLPAISHTQCAMATCLSHPHSMCTVKSPSNI
jgi:hypothetical protein